MIAGRRKREPKTRDLEHDEVMGLLNAIGETSTADVAARLGVSPRALNNWLAHRQRIRVARGPEIARLIATSAERLEEDSK